jgi:spermine synthase
MERFRFILKVKLQSKKSVNSANCSLLHFCVESRQIADKNFRENASKVIKENVEKYFGNLKMVYDMLVDDGYLCIFKDNSGVIFTLRFFNEDLITLNIEYFKKALDKEKLPFSVSFFISNKYLSLLVFFEFFA